MRLRVFGKATLENSPAQLSPQLLVLLSYLRLEGMPSRNYLAQLFWSHLEGEFTKKGERKDLSNVGVALATLKRDTGLELSDLLSVPCDACDFLRGWQDANYEYAFSCYHPDGFLAGLEQVSRLSLGSDLSTWLLAKREDFALKAQTMLLHLAEGSLNKDEARARHYAEQAFTLNRQLEPALLTRLYRLLLASGSEQAAHVREAFEIYLQMALDNELISLEALHLFLSLALQDETNIVAAQMAVNLSPKQAARCFEELISHKLLGANYQVLGKDIAENYLEQHPALAMKLLAALRDHSPVEQAYAIYQRLYKTSQTFGGMGYWDKARRAYIIRARKLIAQEAFQAATELLGELQLAEHQSQQQPEPESRFLLAYALERLGRFGQGLEVLKDVTESPDICAIKAALWFKTESYKVAKQLALSVVENVPSSSHNSWARAIAANTLGQIAFEEKRLHEAEIYFDDAAVQWRLAGMASRELGALMNRANVFASLERLAQATGVYQEVIRQSEAFPLLKLRALLNSGHLYEERADWQTANSYYQQALEIAEKHETEAPVLLAQVLNNHGYVAWQLGHLELARVQSERAMAVALASAERLLYAVALGNLAAMNAEPGKLEAALRLLVEIGSKRELEVYQELYESVLTKHLQESLDKQDLEGIEVYAKRLAQHYKRTAQEARLRQLGEDSRLLAFTKG